MNDGDKQNPDEFEDEFDFDEEFDESEIEELDLDALSNEAKKVTDPDKNPTKSPLPNASKSPIPLVIAVLAISFLGWKGYQWIFNENANDPNIEALKKGTQPTIPEELNTPNPVVMNTEPAPSLNDDISANQSFQSQVKVNSEATSPSNLTLDSNLTDEVNKVDISGSNWLVAENEVFNMNSQISPSRITFEQVVNKINANETNTNKRLAQLEENLAELVNSVSTMDKNVNQTSIMLDNLNQSFYKLTQEILTLKNNQNNITTSAPAVTSYPLEGKGSSSDKTNYYQANKNGTKAQPAYSDKQESSNEVRPSLNIQALGQPKAPGTSSDNKFNPSEMTVYAIIPGRAWLRAEEGKIITVTEGESIDGLGKVLAIDAHEGTVIMSSGLILK